MKIDALLEEILGYTKPIADELGYEVYHIEYVKENNEYYLRIYIDQDGGIKLSDCEALSRRVSDILDEKDPITTNYFLEVSSPGLNRGLYKEEHFKRFVGKDVFIRFLKSFEGKKNVKGILKEINENNIIVDTDGELFTVPKEKIKSANLDGEI